MSLYKFGKVVVSGIFHLLFRIRLEGTEHLIEGENYLVCANHVSNLDPPMLGVCLPFQTRFMAKEELFRNKLFGGLIRALGAFPVKRESRDIGAIKTALSVLKGGSSLVMFPEGGRSDGVTLRRGKHGAALVALKSNVKILPVGISGGYRLFRKNYVRIGKPLDFCDIASGDGGRETSEKLQELTDNYLMPEIARLAEMKMYER